MLFQFIVNLDNQFGVCRGWDCLRLAQDETVGSDLRYREIMVIDAQKQFNAC